MNNDAWGGISKDGELNIKVKIFIIIIIILGLCYNIAFVFYFDKIYPENCEINAIAEVVSIKEEKEYYDKYIVKVLNNKDIENSKNTKLILYIDKNYELLPGNVINICGEFEKAEVARNSNGFSYRNYLKQDKIYGIIYCNKISVIANKNDIVSITNRIRMNISTRINKLYKDEYSAFLDGILIGKTDNLSTNIKENFRDSNLSHILAISGMHVSYIILGMNLFIQKIIVSKKMKNNILIVILLAFSLLTGLSVSCVRACIMNGMILLGSNLHRKNNFYITFIFSFFIILMINPFNIFNTGMWLSYAGTLGIVLFYNFFVRMSEIKLKRKAFKVLYIRILKVIFVSISAQILIFPIMLYTFNTISLTFFISNFLISFLIGPILALGYISVILSYIFFPFGNLLAKLENFLIYIIFKISEICAQIPFSKIYIPTPSFILVMTYYLSIILIIYFFKRKEFYMIKIMLSFKYLNKAIKNKTNKKIKEIVDGKKIYIVNSSCSNKINNRFNNDKSNKLNLRILKITFLIILIFIIAFNLNNYYSELKINFIDVGQGDCTLIITPKGKKIIIDGGEGNSGQYDYGENVVLPYLLDKGIMKIDYLIVSHCDSDHIGGLFAVLKNIKVEKIIISIQAEESKQLDDLMEIAKKKNIEVIVLEAGNELKLDKEIKMEVLWPVRNDLIKDNVLNNNSLVLKISYNEFSILFTGDIEELAEKEIIKIYDEIELNATILKVAHHGSKTSSTEEFLEAVQPKIALIGVGKDNKFGHPSEDVITRLNNLGTNIFRTDENGEISIYISNNGKLRIKKFINYI